MKILIVDDQATVRTAMRTMLKKLGFSNVVQADDGDTALEQLQMDDQIGLIISDMHMPQISGIEFLEKVRLNPKLKNIPFLMVTTDSDMKTVVKATQAGVSGYLIKPFTEKTIREKLEMLGFKPVVEKANTASPSINIKILIVDDQESIRKAMRIMLKKLGFLDIIDADDGDTALNILKTGEKIGLIISDVHMARMSGLSLLEAVKLDSNLKTIPFIMVTTDSEMKTVVKATQFGVNGYIIKPFTEKSIKEKLEMIGIKI